MKLRVYAKINLALYVTGVGTMHTLDGVMASVGIYDDITVTPSEETVVYMDGVMADRSNSAYKAIEVFEKKYYPVRVRVDIEKGIPMEAGLGGSSADSAGVLYALGSIYGERVEDIAVLCGSDVPFMMKGGVARVEGIGETVSPIRTKAPDLIIVKPSGGVSTALAYREYDAEKPPIKNETIFAVRDIENGDYSGEYLANDLETSAIKINPLVKDVKRSLTECGLNPVVMTGSGSAVWAMGEGLEDIATVLSRVYEYVKITKVMDRGIEVYEY